MIPTGVWATPGTVTTRGRVTSPRITQMRSDGGIDTDDLSGGTRRLPQYTCSAVVEGCRGTSRRCRMPVRKDGAYCKHHGGPRLPPDQACTVCWSWSWEPVEPSTPDAVSWRGGRYLCALCASEARANAAVAALNATLEYAERVTPGRGAVEDVCHFVRQRLAGL